MTVFLRELERDARRHHFSNLGEKVAEETWNRSMPDGSFP
jgi:hypothetical protein